MRLTSPSLLAALLLATPLSAQVEGIVQDPDGKPVAEVLLELWAPTARLAASTSSASGRFSFPPDASAAGLWVRRIGFRPRRIELSRADTRLVITLEPLLLAQPTLVAAVASLCPHVEEPEARAAVVAMAYRYSQGTDSLGLATYAWATAGRVAVPGLDNFDTTKVTLAQLGSAGLARRYLRRQIQAYGYALPAGGGFGEATGAWEYIRLGSTFPQHFADSVFRVRHRFYFLPAADGGHRVAFCPTTRGLPSIEGILELSPTTALLRATWVFRTPKPVEEAGGEVTLAPPSLSSPSLLLPVAGLYWRRLSQSSYYQAWEKYERWVIGRSDSIPRLPPVGQ